MSTDTFVKHEVVPDVIPAAPACLLKVTYDDVSIEPGQVMTPTQVQNQPRIEYEAASGEFYTLIMTDPDAPSRENPKFREWHHFMVNNIPGNELDKGEVTSAYIGSGPPKDTGLHRYVFLLYRQTGGRIDLSKVAKLGRTTDNRGARPASQILAELGGAFELTAANFYQAEFDDYVPKLYAELGKNK